MDSQRFDLLVRALATSRSRRKTLGLLAAAGIGFRPLRSVSAQDAAACEAGLTYCAEAGACVDLQSDLSHCGACGAVCESELVPVACRDGECVRANCPEGVEYCGIVDGCRDLATDPAHCGGCGNACASGVCSGGACTPAGDGCPEGQVACNGVCVATCCNNEHCGACGNACTPPFTCFEGICDCPSGLCCAEGEVVCTGSCVATCCDNNNCGACGNVCTRGQTCFEGQCGCPSGNCPPVTLPNTGTGSAGANPRGAMWPAWAAAGATALAAIGWSRTTSRPDRPGDRSP